MEAIKEPGLWRALGAGVPVSVAALGAVGLWVDWFVLVALVAAVAGLVGVHTTTGHHPERALALSGLLVIGVPGLLIGLCIAPLATADFVIGSLTGRGPE